MSWTTLAAHMHSLRRILDVAALLHAVISSAGRGKVSDTAQSASAFLFFFPLAPFVPTKVWSLSRLLP